MSENDTKTGVSNYSLMSRFLRPNTFDIEPNTTAADLKWTHWYATFSNFLTEEGPEVPDSMKLKLLINHLGPSIFAFIRESKTFDDATRRLNEVYIKPKNEIYTRHVLSTRRQLPGESISEFIRSLKQLAHDCVFKDVTAEVYKQEYIRDAFITGISSPKIRQRLLENIVLSLDEALNQALTYESAEKNSLAFTNNAEMLPLNALSTEAQCIAPGSVNSAPTLAATRQPQRKRLCFFCGSNSLHQRVKCPAFNSICQLCSKKGHFASVCRSHKPVAYSISTMDNANASGCISAAAPTSLRKATKSIFLNNTRAEALIDTGSSMSFIDEKLVNIMNLKRVRTSQSITLASLSHSSYINALCYATIKLDHHTYKQHPLLIVYNLCADVIIGLDLLKNHRSLELQFGGDREPLLICNVMQASVPPASIFSNLSPDVKPIAIKTRNFNKEDELFIKEEINNLLEDNVIEPCISPWRAQVLVTSNTSHRKRLVVDYSRTINRYTELDAFPLPRIDSIIHKVAKYNVFSQIDLKSAYHQVPILLKERPMTAFEACGNLYQFTRIPFGVTNGVAAFQRTLQYIIGNEKLEGTFAYLDDVTVCGKTEEEHNKNLERFMNAVQKYKLTLNEKKCLFGSDKINLLGYNIHNNLIKPDESRLKPLLDFPLPNDSSSLKRALGMFAHYSKWVPNFSAKIRSLVSAKIPLDDRSKECFQLLKTEIAKSALAALNETDQLTVETDASDCAIAGTLSQCGRPVAFFFRPLNDSEKKHPAIEKEACAIIECLRKWRHYLIGRHFMLITDQKSVAFMINQKHASKIKNEKIERWRLELSCYKYDVIYRSGKENVGADALSRVCASMTATKLYELHDLLCHPGITRMAHWVRTKNLPYSLQDIKAMIASCSVCANLKPRFVKIKGNLIKATEPFQRLSVDFKGPLPSNTPNKYILTIIDEYSRFPFAYPCKDLSALTVIRCLNDLFFTFGSPAYIHSDRGTAFMSKELKEFLALNGVASSRTTPYNPEGNGQVERLNGTLWKTIQLHLRSRQLDVRDWERALPIALHSIRSLLCTATNETPHERLFFHTRRSPTGESTPTWLLSPGPVLMKKNLRLSKYDSAVEEVELLHGNPYYSHIRQSDGRETTVSNRQLAPLPLEDAISDASQPDSIYHDQATYDVHESNGSPILREQDTEIERSELEPAVTQPPVSHRPTRARRPPVRLADYILDQE